MNAKITVRHKFNSLGDLLFSLGKYRFAALRGLVINLVAFTAAQKHAQLADTGGGDVEQVRCSIQSRQLRSTRKPRVAYSRRQAAEQQDRR